MRIGYNTLSENPRGDSGSMDYFIEMASLLPELDKQNEYLFIVSKSGKRNFPHTKTIYGGYSNEIKVRRIVSENLLLPALLKKNKIDLLFTSSSGGIAPYFLSKNIRLVLGVFATQHLRSSLVSWQKKLYRNTLLKRSFEKAEILIANSEMTRNDIISTDFVKPDKIRVIPHGIDTKVFNNNMVSEQEETYFKEFGIKQPYFLFVSNIYPYKNLFTVIEAFGKFIGKNTSSYQLVVIGEFETNTKNEYLKVISDISNRYNLKNNLKFLGKIYKKQLRVFYKKAEAYIQPSLFETFGKTTLEAMSCGCPVIGANISATPEVLSGSGLLFEAKDANDLMRKMEVMAFDNEVKKECSLKGLARAANFTLVNEAKNYISVFNELEKK